ncbi:MAG: UDP-N-acetylmuramate dehydrogenase [Longimicrobiales bacterium]
MGCPVPNSEERHRGPEPARFLARSPTSIFTGTVTFEPALLKAGQATRSPPSPQLIHLTPSLVEQFAQAAAPAVVRTEVPLAPFTTFKVGGPADVFVSAASPEQLCAAVEAARNLGIPYFLLGRGANILIGDGGFRGVVIRCEIGGINVSDDGLVKAGAGVDCYPDLIQASVGAGLGGLHHFVGIPSTVGGAVWQNLHFLSPAPERERTVFFEEVMVSATILSGQAVETVPASYFNFGYDYSTLHDTDDIVLDVTLQLTPTPIPELRQVIKENLEWRDERHPDLWLYPCAGSIFKKIEGVGAGRLIDQCGLKGHVHGAAQIFHKHANIIVNLGGATAAEICTLIDLARNTVARELGYELEPEIGLIGEF